jgi:hypothetical protein
MEDAGTPWLCAGRRPYAPFYRTVYSTPMERSLATVSSVNREPDAPPDAAGVSLKEAISWATPQRQ